MILFSVNAGGRIQEFSLESTSNEQARWRIAEAV
jgi:hypothetical protein